MGIVQKASSVKKRTYNNRWITDEIIEYLASYDGRILDLGGGLSPYYRASTIVDIAPYDAKRLTSNSWGRDKKRDHRHQTIDYRLGAEDGGQRIEDSGRRDEGGDLSSKGGSALGGKPEGHKELSEKIELTNSEQLNNLQLDNEQLYGHWSPGDYVRIDATKETLPFSDKEFDLGLYSHMLEDVDNPFSAFEELNRVSKMVAVIAPSRLIEQTKGIDHPRYCGFGHHKWMLELEGDHIVFTRKSSLIENKGCHINCPWGMTMMREAGVFFYHGSAVKGRERKFRNSEDEMENLLSFVSRFQNRRSLFELHPRVRSPRFWIWRLKQLMLDLD